MRSNVLLKMDLPTIAPKWARIAIIPAVVGFGLFTVGLAVLFAAACFHDPEVTKKGGWILIVGGIPIIWLFGIVTYRGADLWRFRNYRAALEGDQLLVSSGQAMAPVPYDVKDLEIVDHRRMQIIYVRLGRNGHKIFALDYYYSAGMELIGKLRKRIGEQAAAEQPAISGSIS
jgi:hypothetical protein